MKRLTLILGAVLLVLSIAISFPASKKASAAVPGVNQLIDQDSSGDMPNAGLSYEISPHSVSGNGEYVVFTSAATNLVSNDTNSYGNVYVRNTQTGTTTMVDVSTSGTQADNGGGDASISYSGRYVVFVSSATNLVSGVDSGQNLYIRDLVAGTTKVVDTNSSGELGSVVGDGYPDVSSDGRFVVFDTQSSTLGAGYSGYYQIADKDMDTGAEKIIPSIGDHGAVDPSIDCDGNIVTFTSDSLDYSTNVGSNDNYQQNPAYYDVYIVKLGWDENELGDATINSGPSEYDMPSPQVSCDGNEIVWSTSDRVLEYNRVTGAEINITLNSNQSSGYTVASISNDGRYVAFVAKATSLDSSHPQTYMGSYSDVYVSDTKEDTTQLVSFTALGNMSGLVPDPTNTYTVGAQPEVSISGDGSTVVYTYDTPDSSNTNGELISGVDTGFKDLYSSQTGF